MEANSQTTTQPPSSQAPTIVAFIILVIIGGGNTVAVRLSNFDLPPFWGAAMRMLPASGLFWLALWLRRVPFPPRREIGKLAVYGFLSIGLYYALFYWALVGLSASLSIVILSLTPLFTFFLAVAQGQERFQWRGLIGAAVAVIGVGVTVGANFEFDILWGPFLALVLAAVVLAESNVYFKTILSCDPLLVNAVATLVGGGMLVGLSLAAGETWILPPTPTAWWIYGYLVLAGTVFVFYLYIYILERWSASITSYSFLLFPIATIIIAAWLADEVVTPQFVVGTGGVLVGVWLGALTQQSET